MEALSKRVLPAGLASLARITIQLSLVVAIGVGTWLLSPQPAFAVAGAGAFVLAAIAARTHFEFTAAGILFLAYTATGLQLAVSPAVASTPFWLAAFAGLVAGGTSWTAWKSPRQWQWPLMFWMLGVALSWPVVVAREADFSLSSPREVLLPVLATNVAHLAIGLWLDATLMWTADRIRRCVGWPLLASAVLSAAAALYQGFVDITFLNAPPWTTGHRAVGLMADANPLAVATALCAPLAVALFRTSGPRRSGGIVTGLTLCALLWYASWLTNARSMIILVPAGALGVFGAFAATRIGARRTVLVTVIAVAIGLASVLVVGATAPMTTPIGRLYRTLPLASPQHFVYETLWRRDGYGLAAARAVSDHPIAGVGNGAFNWMASHFHHLEGEPTLPPDNAQNLWRQTLAERGLLGFVAIVGFTIATLRLLFRQANREDTIDVWILKSLIVGLGVVLMFGLPTQSPAIAVTAVSLVAWLRALVAPHVPWTMTRSVAIVGWLLAISGVMIDLWGANSSLRPALRALRVGELYSYGFGEEIVSEQGVRLRVVERDAVLVMPVTSAKFRLRCWVRGNEIQRVRIWQDRKLVADENTSPGTMIERVLDMPRDAAHVLLEISSSPPGVLVLGETLRE